MKVLFLIERRREYIIKREIFRNKSNIIPFIPSQSVINNKDSN